MKRFLKVTMIAICFVIFGVLILQSVYTNEVRTLVTNAQKYTTNNIPKNTGWRLNLLKTADETLKLYPKMHLVHANTIEKIRNDIIIGRQFSRKSPDFLVLSMLEFKNAIKRALPGQIIELHSGTFIIDKKITLRKSGEPENPIIIRGSSIGETVLEIQTLVGLQVSASHIVIENLSFSGKCKRDNNCEHALQLKGESDFVEIKGNDFSNFNAAIKSSGLDDKDSNGRVYPDHVRVESNTFVNDWPRDTKSAVTPIDVVGGNYWNISKNFIADFEKLKGNKISYGAFLKGNGKFGVIDGNIVACSWKVPYSSDSHVRIGLSFGGGGTQAQFCKDGKCQFEHQKGVMANNIVLNCPTDVGIYINNADEIIVDDNFVFGTTGIDVNRKSRNVEITNNYLQGSIRWRNESAGFDRSNTEASSAQLFDFYQSTIRKRGDTLE